MPKVSESNELEVRRAIRDAYAIDPLITQRKVMQFVEKKIGRAISWDYLTRLLKKVKGDARPRFDKEKLEPRVQEMRETFRIARENLIQIAYGQTLPIPTQGERMTAWRTIGMLGKLLLDAEMDLGIFDRKLGTLDVDHRLRPLEPENRDLIVKAFEMYHIEAPVSRKIERVAPVMPEPTIIPNEPTKPQPKPKEAQRIPTAGESMVVSK